MLLYDIVLFSEDLIRSGFIWDWGCSNGAQAHATDGGGHNISRNKLKVIGYGAQCMSYRKLGGNWSLFVVGVNTRLSELLK